MSGLVEAVFDLQEDEVPHSVVVAEEGALIHITARRVVIPFRLSPVFVVALSRALATVVVMIIVILADEELIVIVVKY